MTREQTIHKAVVAFITTGIALLAVFGLDLDHALGPYNELVVGVLGSLVSGFLVWFIPNRDKRL